MTERYFSGFNFKKFEQQKHFEIVTIPCEKVDFPTTPIKTVHFNDFMDNWKGIKDKSEEPQIWDSNQIQQEFADQLAIMDSQIKSPKLTIQKGTFSFVTPDEMCPQNEEERQRLIQRYGDYIADGGSGRCVRMSDGSYILKIGLAGQEGSKSKDDVLQVMGHEYGHTLGKYLEDPVLEELKAYAFANLFMRYYYDMEYRVYQMDASTVHDTALFWLEQLLDKQVSEEAILAHLTGRKFGKSYPRDYLNSVNVRDRGEKQ